MSELKFRQPLHLKGKFHGWHYWGFIKQKGLSDYVFTSPIGNDKTQEEVMKTSQQFTGLRDKNHKEIYEGDILDDRDCNLPLKVIYKVDKGAFFLISVFKSDDEDDLVSEYDLGVLGVIGNIYENPKLLLGKK